MHVAAMILPIINVIHRMVIGKAVKHKIYSRVKCGLQQFNCYMLKVEWYRHFVYY